MRPMSGGTIAAAACCLIIGRLAEALQADQNSLARRPLPSPPKRRFFPRRRTPQAMMHRALVAAFAITTAQA
jgi:hypothetical protein